MVGEKESSTVFDNFLFPKIFHTFRIAIHWKTLVIAFLAVVVICLAGRIMDLIFAAASSSWSQDGVFIRLWEAASVSFHSALKSLFAFNILGVAESIAGYFVAVGSIFKDHYIYCIIFCVIKLAVISVCGGAICRIAALQFARGEKPGVSEALRFSTKKFLSFFITPLAPVAMIIFIGLFIFLLGLIGNIPRVGELLMSVFMFLAFFAGALLAVIFIGAIAGFNLMFPAVAYDGSDSFDAISRSFGYVYAKPWRMGFYTLVALVYGAICYMFVRFFAFLMLLFTYWFLRLGILGDNSKLTAIWPGPSFWDLVGPSGLPANWTQSLSSFLIHLCIMIVVGLVVSFIISFYFSANTIIYSLMRNKVDNTTLEDIYVPFNKARTEPSVDESEPKETQ